MNKFCLVKVLSDCRSHLPRLSIQHERQHHANIYPAGLLIVMRIAGITMITRKHDRCIQRYKSPSTFNKNAILLSNIMSMFSLNGGWRNDV